MCSTGRECTVRAEGVCLTGWGKLFVLHPSACTTDHQPVLHIHTFAKYKTDEEWGVPLTVHLRTVKVT